MKLRAAFWIIITVLVLGVAFPTKPQVTPNWTDQFNNALDLLRAGNVVAARDRFEDLWLANRTQYDLAYAIGSALDSAGDHADATAWYERALRLNPSFAPAYNNLALNLASRGYLERALPLLRKATQLNPADERAFYNLGLLCLKLDQPVNAASAFEQAHKLKPHDTDPVLRLAYAKFLAGQRTEGIRALDEYLSLTGGTSEGTLKTIEILNSVGMYNEALERARKAFPSSGQDRAWFAYEEALALFHLRRYKEALATLSEFSSGVSGTLEVLLLLGSCQAMTGNLPEAVTTFQAAVRLAPDRAEPYYRLALAFMLGSRNRDAEEVLLTGLRHIPESPLLLYALAALDESEGKYSEAAKYVQRSIQVLPRQPAAWMLYGDLEVRVGEYGQAMNAYKTSLQFGFTPEAAIRYADILSSLNDYDRAKQVLDLVLRKQPLSVEAYVALGRLYLKQKEYSKAVPVLQKAISLDQNNSDAHLFLGQTLYRLDRPDEAKREIALAAKVKKQSNPARLLRRVLVPITGGSLENGDWHGTNR